jgi:uncharacterized protein
LIAADAASVAAPRFAVGEHEFCSSDGKIRANPRLVAPIGVDPRLVELIRVNPRLVVPIRVNPRLVEPIRVDPRLVEPIRVDPRLVELICVDPRLVELICVDPRLVDDPRPVELIRVDPRPRTFCADPRYPHDMLAGLIADTHGLIRPDALRALEGVAVILHAGDVGGLGVIAALEAIAPVHAVCGNVDPPEVFPPSIAMTLEGVRLHVSHGHEVGSPTPERLIARYTADVIVYGHTHRPLVQRIGTTLVINPGAAGPRRFDLRPSVTLLSLPNLEARLVELAR